MADFREHSDLRAPGLVELRLAALLRATNEPRARRLIARLLSDPWDLQGVAEYYAHDLDVGVEPDDVPRHLVALRHAGWIHQRVGGLGLMSRVRRHDLVLRFPDVMGSLRVPVHVVGGDRRDPDWVAAQLRQLSASL